MKKLIGAAVTATAIALGAAPVASAEPISGCEEVPWGFLGSQRRAICDTVRHTDGGWLRARVIYRPAYYANARSSCYGGYYSSSCTYYPGGYVDQAVFEQTSYIVFDDNVVPGEPGHLANGFRP